MGTLLEIGLSNAVLASVLAVLAASLAQLCRQPALSHSLWLLVLLKLLTPPLIPVPISWPTLADTAPDEAPSAPAVPEQAGSVAARASDQQAEPPPGARMLPQRRDAPPPQPPAPAVKPPVPAAPPEAAQEATAPSSWSRFIVPLWLAGSLLWLAWVVLHVARFQRLLRFARTAPAELQDLVKDLARQLGLARSPAVWLVPGAVSPMLWSIGIRPRLLFPAGLLERLDREQLMTLLVHELAHLRRRDHWVRLVELAVLCLYWWHPVVWWARRELHEAEEQCCDAWVVWALAGAGRAYALALLQTVAFFSHARSPLPVAASGIGQVPHLRRRLTMIMKGTTSRTLSWVGGLAVAGLGLLVLPLWAQREEKDNKGQPVRRASSRQEQIEILRKALQILEEQERAARKTDGDRKDGGRREADRKNGGRREAEKKQDSAEIQKARAEVKALEEHARAKHQELAQVMEKLRAAADRLAKLEGHPVPERRSGGRFAPRGLPEANRGSVLPPRGVRFRPPVMQGRPADLEKKLDRLLQEVDELRRELRRAPRAPRGMRPPVDPRRAPAPERERRDGGSRVNGS